jgi:glyoxalase-like protein
VSVAAELDHLVVAAATLQAGIDYVASRTGVAPQRGGKHVAMGTHNALLRLGRRVYLEVIAVDPDATAPARRRWFDLDDPELRADLMERPRLIHWVARTNDIAAASARCPVALGSVHSLSRGDYRWRITIPESGERPGNGLVPTLIQWDVAQHPADALPESNVSLAGFAATHPDPQPIRRALAALGVDHALPVSYDRDTRLAAMLRTPLGQVAL